METPSNNGKIVTLKFEKQLSLHDAFSFGNTQFSKTYSINSQKSLDTENYRLENEGIIKLKRLINELAKMNLNMNIIYIIIEQLNLDGDFEYEIIFNEIIDKYYNAFISNEDNLNQKNTDQLKFSIFAKLLPQNMFQRRINSKTLSNSDSFNNNQKPFNLPPSLVLVMKEKTQKNKEQDVVSTEKFKFNTESLPIFLDKNDKIKNLIPHVALKINEENQFKEKMDEEQTIMINSIDEEGSTLNCIICLSDKPIQNFNPILKHDFCDDCIQIYIKECINSSKILNIICPCSDKCGINYDDDLIQQICISDPNLYNKYLKFKKIHQLNMDPYGRWCVRQGCENFMKGDANTKKITCNICQQEMCFTCRNIWHLGSCEEALDSDFKEYQKKILVKRCPKCRSRIEKNEGCNHMTCARCSYEFCWLCCRKYSSNHYEWYNICGCPNMQDRDFKSLFVRLIVFCEIFFKFLGYLFLILFLILLALAIYPFALIFGVFTLPVSIFSEILWKFNNFTRILLGILIFILGIILSPIIIILEIFPGTCIFVVKMIRNDDDS